MRTRIKKIDNYNQEIELIEQSDKTIDGQQIIIQQLKRTSLSNINLLQQIQKGIYLLTVKKNQTTTPLDLKKISDRVQYAMLPSAHENAIFCKITLNNLKNQCCDQRPMPLIVSLTTTEDFHHCNIYFFYDLDGIKEMLNNNIKIHDIHIKEVLSNRTAILSYKDYNYPFPLAKLPSLAIWHNFKIDLAIANEMILLKNKFALLNHLIEALHSIYPSSNWLLSSGHLRYTHQGVTRSLDYSGLLDDIIHAGYQEKIEKYLKNFDIHDLDTSATFPTVSVRSPIHLKARPECLSQLENGYAVVAAKEAFGKQTDIVISHQVENVANIFSLWFKRTQRHIFRHLYKARVIFASSKEVFAIVGEQAATMAVFPSLLKGAFEALNIPAPKSVRVIAHNEDILTIGSDTASWADISQVSEKASLLFRMVAVDGSDPLSLFEQVSLPLTGAGNFQFKIIPDAFFELIETAQTMKHSLPPGHDHYLLALAYECLHEWGLAVVEFKKALRLDMHDPDIHYGLGQALLEIGKTSEALPFLKRAFDMMPEDAEVANHLGQTSLSCGEITDAIKAFERAVRLSPGCADYLKNLGEGYLLAARPIDAVAMLNKAIRCDPHSAGAHASLARLYLANGDESSAKKHALIAFRENPSDSNIANLLWRLMLQKNN